MWLSIRALQLEVSGKQLGGELVDAPNLRDGAILTANNNEARQFIMRNGARWIVPDKVTAQKCAELGKNLVRVDPERLQLVPVAGIFPTMDVTGSVSVPQDDGTQSFYYLERGQAFQLNGTKEEVSEKFGAPSPVETLLPTAEHQEILKGAPLIVVTGGDPWQSIHAYLLTIPLPDLPAPGLTITPDNPSSVSNTAEGGVTYQVTQEKRIATNIIDRFPAVSPVGDAIWPGALVQGKSIDSGLLAPIQIDDRSPGTIEIITELVARNGGAPHASNIDRPSSQSVNAVRRTLLAGIQPIASTDGMKLDLYTLHDEQQMSVRLGASVKGTGWSGSANASVAGSMDRSDIVVKLEQVFYRVTFTPAGAPARYFGDAVTVDELKVYSGKDNPPCYVSEVEYGRIFLLRISSEASSSDVTAEVHAAWQAAVSGDVNVQANSRQKTSSYQVQVASVGMTGSTTFQAIGGLVDTLNALKSTADYTLDNPGSIISYTLRYLVDGSVAKAQIGPTSYTAYVRADIPTRVLITGCLTNPVTEFQGASL